MTPPLQSVIVPVTSLQQNATVTWCTQSGRGVVTDPGGDLDHILAVAARHPMKIEKILLTHGHIDHTAMAGVLSQRLGVPIEGPHRADQFWLDMIPELSAQYGIPGGTAFTPDRWLDDGDTVTIGEQTLDVLFTPGHSPGHVVFHHAPSALAIVGDVLFQGSVGRTDLPGGDMDTLVRSVVEKLWPLGDATFIPGHGPVSSFARERAGNPFVGDRALAAARPGR